MNAHGQTICLNMIVRNEAHVIRRCLDSLRPVIDSWVIVDTGSTDGTQEIIREHLRDVPGELFERPWVNFAHNRSEALELARGRGDYVIVIDADETLQLSDGFVLPRLTADSYNVEMLYGGYTYYRKQLVRNALPWKYSGVLHEYIQCDQAQSEEVLHGLRTMPRHDGARARDPHTYERDAEILEQALLDEPDNTRYVFYLAQSYRDGGNLDEALRCYRRRAQMGGWTEEIWFSLYQLAQIEERKKSPWPEVMQLYLDAWQFRPDRAGPLFRIGMHYQAARQYATSLLFLAKAMQIPMPEGNRLFVERALYDYMIAVEYAVASYYAGDHVAAIETNNNLLRSGLLPPHAFDHVTRNRRYSIDALHPKRRGAKRGRVTAVVPVCDAGTELDETIESLLRQKHDALDVVCIDAGKERLQVPDHPHISVIRCTAAGRAAAVNALIASCDENDVVMLLSPGQRLATPETAERIASAFEDPDCHVLYAQYRLASGKLGLAEPASSAAAHGPHLAGEAPLVFRAPLWQAANGSAASLWAVAGFEHTRFLDDVTVTFSEAKLRTPVKVTAPGPPASPMISCLMVTRDRLALARRAIRSYADQTHPNRELLIVTDGEPWYTRALQRYVDEREIANVRFLHAARDTPLGALRNLSLNEARGEIVCQWDDDDCCHPTRLASQLDEMTRQNGRACFFSDHLQYLESERVLLWIDWTLDSATGREWQIFPGSLMMWNDPRFRYPERGPYARRGEDSALLAQLQKQVPVVHIAGMGHLYLYQFHGRNTFPKEHHYRISHCSMANDFVESRADDIRRAAAYYQIATPLLVAGRSGPVFAIG